MQPNYAPAGEDYLARRKLRRHARVPHLWAMGVGAVISGDFFGWNFGLAAGGFGGMLLAVLVMTAMYIGLCFSIAEMSPALPHAGGAYSFARTAMGPWAGYITGLAENMEYILTPAVIVVGIGGYLGAVFGTPGAWEPAWWLLAYGLFVALNVWGVEMTFHVSVIVTLAALAVLAVFWLGAVPHFDPARWAAPYFPSGRSIGASALVELPFALWLYLGIEQLPLAAEESHDPREDMPRGILYGLVTLIGVSFLTVVLSAGIAPGAAKVASSNEPLFLGFQTIFGHGLKTRVLALVACTGLIASFHTIIFAYGRQIYSLSRAGYFPTWLSVTHGTRKTPQRALVAGSALGFAAALAIRLTPQGSPVGAVLLNMAVFGAVLAYMLQMVSFLVLRARFQHIERPYRSPLGMCGAALALLIAGVTLVVLFRNPDYNKGVIGAAVWFVLGLGYHAVYGRHRLVLAPEEAAAIEHRKKEGRP
ncbi:MAG TPA: amino acid permease [Candidatus Acidoferrales bacterium]|nr:amino acid permease [Candidatus Acidoferrales bacterium]